MASLTYTILLFLGFISHFAISSNIPSFVKITDVKLAARDTNWTTQAFQTHCDNINYQDYTDCCQRKSGPSWRSCNNVGYWSLSGSTILCYSILDGHTCCADNSVCDNGLSCLNGHCSQTTSSVTVCEDGCVSYNGMGCTSAVGGSPGTCKLDQVGSSTAKPATLTVSYSTGSIASASETSRSTSSAVGTVETSTSSGSSSSSDKPGLSVGAIIGIVISAVVAVIGGIFGCVLKWKRYKNSEKRDKQAMSENHGKGG